MCESVASVHTRSFWTDAPAVDRRRPSPGRWGHDAGAPSKHSGALRAEKNPAARLSYPLGAPLAGFWAVSFQKVFRSISDCLV